jgi:hypothetical protein
MHFATPLLCLAAALLASAEHAPHARSHKGLLRRFGAAQVEQRAAEAGSSLDPRGELARRAYSGRATYYAAGLGACGTVNKASDAIIAMNSAQFSGSCYRTITIGYGGKTATATVTDLCPGCPYGAIDMSQGLFEYFADTSLGVIQVQWAFGNSLDDAPRTTTTRRTSTTRPPPPPTTTSTRSSTRSQPTSSSSSTPSPTSSSSSSSEADETSSTSTEASSTPVSNFDGLNRVVGVMFDMANAGQEGEPASSSAAA